MRTFFDIQPPKQLVKPKKEVLDLIECMDTVKHVKEEHSHYQHSTFSKYKGSLRMHYPAPNFPSHNGRPFNSTRVSITSPSPAVSKAKLTNNQAALSSLSI